jgi:nucleotide-binding universal stress UspA family protein
VTRIVVGVDGSAHAAAALRWAVAEAELRGDRVVAVFAWGYIPPGHAGDGHTFDAGYTRAAADATLVAALDEAVGSGIAEGIERRVPCDLPPKALLAAATGADLLVIGARGVGGFRGLLLGSVSQSCLHHTTGTLAIVRDLGSGGGGTGTRDAPLGVPGGRIVVGMDNSEAARRALRWALDEARRRKAGLDVVHAWRPPYLGARQFTPSGMDVNAIEARAGAVFDRVVDGEVTRQQPGPVERILVRGGAARAILDTAAGADLVVLGSRGLGGFEGLLLGSVSHQVAHHVRCPLVVVR